MGNFREFKEHNVRAGLGTALCYRLSSEAKYHILAPVESLPAVFGTPDTIEYSSTTNRNVTNVMGKNSTETVEINLPYNLDYINICSLINGLEVDFAYIDLDDFSAQKFTGTPRYHLADVGTSDIKTIVLSIAVTSAEEEIEEDVYDLFQDTVSFLSAIPAKLEIEKGNTTGVKINVSVDPSTATIVASSDNSNIEATYASGVVTIACKSGTTAGSAIVTIKASATDYAPNERRIKVIIK